jgi:hypothetical protein
MTFFFTLAAMLFLWSIGLTFAAESNPIRYKDDFRKTLGRISMFLGLGAASVATIALLGLAFYHSFIG